MENTRYDTIGRGYTTHRRADRRIVETLVSLLGLPAGACLTDIGAGSGNYSLALANRGFKIKAVEPSAVMRAQAAENRLVEWIEGTAESIPLPDSSVDGVIIMLALHHFASLREAAAEIHRVCPNGPVVIFTCDPRQSAEFWFADYFPAVWQDTFRVFPPIDEIIAEITAASDWSAERLDFPLPSDLEDKFMISGWRTPQLYLDATFRQGTSGFALADEQAVAQGLARLRRDLEIGYWDRKYGDIKRQDVFEAGFQFLKFKSEA